MLDGLEFPQILILLLLGLLFFKEQMVGWIGSRFGAEEKDLKDAPEWARRLIQNQDSLLQYGNHDVTERYDNIDAKLDTIHTTLQKHNDVELDTSKKVDEILKYGVVCRTK